MTQRWRRWADAIRPYGKPRTFPSGGYPLGAGQAPGPIASAHAARWPAGEVVATPVNSMMPEAFKHGGPLVGLLTVLGYLPAAALTVLQ